VKEAPRCGDCGAPMVLKEGPLGHFYGCTRFPRCRGRHGAHQRSGEPLGKPADKATRAARVEAHFHFDAFYKARGMRRATAYRWLAAKLAMKEGDCHIARFDAATCQRVVAVVRGHAEMRTRRKARTEEPGFRRCEEAYRRAVEHWEACGVCSSAGGEGAPIGALCGQGRLLAETWERYELAEASEEAEGGDHKEARE